MKVTHPADASGRYRQLGGLGGLGGLNPSAPPLLPARTHDPLPMG